ncbi:MAG TPA: hypothetical protein VNQ90_19645 [Chthoniobacteraceae bacterium]|nr:hypothetical protein [Chthoniobacteraceae bacterium]
MKTSLCILYATNTRDPETITRSVASTTGRQKANPVHDYSFELHALEGQVLLIASSDARVESSSIARRFQEWLKKKTSLLSGVRYSVYASAPSHQGFFEFAGTLDSELKRLGAIQVLKHLENPWPSADTARHRARFDAIFPDAVGIEAAAVA